jgi:hypothetical protein
MQATSRIIQNHENINVRMSDKANPGKDHKTGLNLAAVKHTTVQVITLPL